MKLKKLMLLFFTVLLAVALTACGGTPEEEGSSEAAGNEGGDDTIKVGFSQMSNDTAWKIAETESIREEVEKRGWELVFTDAQWQMDKQVSDIEDLITQGVDYILLAPNDYEGYETALASAKEAGIPVILLDREANGVPGEDYVTCITSDFIWEGEACGKWLQEKKAEKGGKMRIVEVAGTPGASVTRDRAQGLKNIVDADPDMEIISSQVGDFDRATAEQVTTNVIQSTGGEFDAIYCHDDEMAMGVINALKAANIKPTEDVYVLGIDGTQNAKISIENGELSAVVTCNPRLGALACEVIEKLMNGEEVPTQSFVEDTLYDSTNIAEYVDAF